MASIADGGNWRVAVAMAAIAAVGPVAAVVYGSISKDTELSIAKYEKEMQVRIAFLDRAIDPDRPPKYRQQVLRFLFASSSDEVLKTWAKDELAAVETEIASLQDSLEKTKRRESELLANLDKQARPSEGAHVLGGEGKGSEATPAANNGASYRKYAGLKTELDEVQAERAKVETRLNPKFSRPF